MNKSKKRRKGVFDAFASGKRKIPILAPVKGGQRPSRSDAKRPCTGIASEELQKLLIYERSELEKKN